MSQMRVGFYGHVRQYHNIKAEIDANIKQVLESGEYVQGPMNKQFEKELAEFHGMKYAVGVGNGTDAIWLTLWGLALGPVTKSSPTRTLFSPRRKPSGLPERRRCL